jgi:hypothetical protein
MICGTLSVKTTKTELLRAQRNLWSVRAIVWFAHFKIKRASVYSFSKSEFSLLNLSSESYCSPFAASALGTRSILSKHTVAWRKRKKERQKKKERNKTKKGRKRNVRKEKREMCGFVGIACTLRTEPLAGWIRGVASARRAHESQSMSFADADI